MAAATKSSEPGNHAKPYLFEAGEKGGNLSKPDFFGAVRRAGPHKTSMFWQGGEVAGTLEKLRVSRGSAFAGPRKTWVFQIGEPTKTYVFQRVAILHFTAFSSLVA